MADSEDYKTTALIVKAIAVVLIALMVSISVYSMSKNALKSTLAPCELCLFTQSTIDGNECIAYCPPVE